MKYFTKTLIVFVFATSALPVAFGQASTETNSEPANKLSVFASAPDSQSEKARFRTISKKEVALFLFPRGAFDQFQIRDEREFSLLAGTKKLYGKPKSKDIEHLQPSAELKKKYKSVLGLGDAGLITLLPDIGCFKNLGVISAAPECIKNDFPGAGAAYSFREETYRVPTVADIVYDGNAILSYGDFANSFFAYLGDEPLTNVTKQNKQIRALTAIQPAAESAQAEALQQTTIADPLEGKYSFGAGIKIVPNATFALRVIAYRGRYFRSIGWMVYNELNYDNRRDVVVVFRVVDGEASKPITLLYRKLIDEKSPKLEPTEEPEEAS
ncbi:MAG: hypothetical protein ACK5NT_04095 [Pyrinomonadaceae bacterium]